MQPRGNEDGIDEGRSNRSWIRAGHSSNEIDLDQRNGATGSTATSVTVTE